MLLSAAIGVSAGPAAAPALPDEPRIWELRRRARSVQEAPQGLARYALAWQRRERDAIALRPMPRLPLPVRRHQARLALPTKGHIVPLPALGDDPESSHGSCQSRVVAFGRP